jgi:hypothetical protein
LRASPRLPRAASCGAEQKSIRKINHPNKPKHGRQALRHLFDAILSRMILIVTGKRAMSLLGEDAWLIFGWLIFAKCFSGASSLRPLLLQSSFG